MKLLTDLAPHFFLYALVLLVGLFVLVLLLWVLGLTFSPLVWLTTNLRQGQCPQCKGLFKKQLVNWEVTGEREVLRTVNRVDHGVLYSNHLLEPNHAIEISRKEQVTFVERTILNHWECKNSTCSHKWQTEELHEWEGSLDK